MWYINTDVKFFWKNIFPYHYWPMMLYGIKPRSRKKTRKHFFLFRPSLHPKMTLYKEKRCLIQLCWISANKRLRKTCITKINQDATALKIKHYRLILVSNFFMKNFLPNWNSVLHQLTVDTPYGTFTQQRMAESTFNS